MRISKVIFLFLFAFIVIADSGGPDAFGYTWIDSRDEYGPEFEWIEIRETGERLARVSDSPSGEQTLTLERPFEFYGELHDRLTVSTNGLIAFGNYSYISYYSSSFPSTGTPNNTIAPCWTYLNPYYSPSDKGIYYQDFGDYCVFEWYNLSEYMYSTNTFTFQIVLDFRTNAIYFNYLDVSPLSSYTAHIGIENGDGRIGLECGSHSSSSSFLEDNLTIRLRGKPVAVPPYFNDLSTGDDFQLPDGDTGWEWGEPIFGPPSAHSGDYCYGTDLDDNYTSPANWVVMTPNLELTDCNSAVLDFYTWYNMETEVDGGFCEVSEDSGTTWRQVHPEGGYPARMGSSSPIAGLDAFTGTTDGWEYWSFDLSRYCGQQIMFRYHLISDATFGAPGWYIDDIGLHEKFGYLRGTVDLAYMSTDGDVNIEIVGTDMVTVSDMDGSFGFDSVKTDTTYTIRFSKGSYLTDSLVGVEIERLDTTYVHKILAPELYFSNFAQTDGGWVADPDSGGWEWGQPQLSPNQAYSDSFCWGTNLSGNYADDVHWTLQQTMYIGMLEYPAIRFRQWYAFAGEFRDEIFDGANLKVSTDGGETFEIVYPDSRYDVTYDAIIADYNHFMSGEPGFGGQENGNEWHSVSFDLSPFADEVTLTIRFDVSSDVMGNARGWYIDDVQIFDNWEAIEESPQSSIPEKLALNAYPNPFNATLHIEYTLPDGAYPTGDMEFYTIDGKAIDRLPLQNRSGSFSTRWYPGDIPGGVYLIILPTSHGLVQQRVIYMK